MEMPIDRMLGIFGALGIVIGVGVAIAMDPKIKGEMIFAIACFIFSGVALCLTVGIWAFGTDFSPTRRVLIASPLFVMICISMVEASRWANGRYQKTENTGAETISQDDQSARSPTIEMSYDLNMFGLPITIPSNSNMHIIFVRDRKVEGVNFVTRDERLQWPTKGPIWPPENVGIARISNHGEVLIFNISANLKFKIGAQESPGGIVEVSYRLPLVTQLGVGGAVSFYVVNLSQDPVLVELPNEVIAQPQGSKVRRSVQVDQRKITFFDQLPILMQSQHKWSGNAMLDPDQRKTKKPKKNG